MQREGGVRRIGEGREGGREERVRVRERGWQIESSEVCAPLLVAGGYFSLLSTVCVWSQIPIAMVRVDSNKKNRANQLRRRGGIPPSKHCCSKQGKWSRKDETNTICMERKRGKHSRDTSSVVQVKGGHDVKTA